MRRKRSFRSESRHGAVLLIFFGILFLVGNSGKISAASRSPSGRLLPPASSDPIAPSTIWPHEESDLAPDPALYFGRLTNGFRYVLMKNREPKDRVSMHLNVQVGSAHEKEDEQGLAHFLEHMLFNGSTHYKPGELVKYFQRIGMQFGPDANAHTGFNETVYDILLPNGDHKSIEEAIVVFKDFAEGALLLASEIDRERGVVLAEKRERDSASYRTYVQVTKFEFQDTLLSRRFPIGTEKVLLQLDRDRVKGFYDRWYRPDKMMLVMVGDFDIPPAVSLITANFEDLRPRSDSPKDPDIGNIRHAGVNTFHHNEKEAGSTQVGIEVMRRIPKHPDTKASKLAMWKKQMAHRMIQHRLDALMVVPDPPFSSVDIGVGLFLQEIEYAQISAECNPDRWEKALTVLETTLRQAIRFGFSETELTRVKKEVAAELDNAVKGSATRNSRYLARKLISSLNNGRIFISPEQEKALFGDAVASLTTQEVHQALQTAWEADHRLVLVTGNADLPGDRQSREARIQAVFQDSLKTPMTRPVSKKSLQFPYLPEPDSTGEILRRTTIPDLGILQVDFKNGVRLNLKKTDFTANDVRANLVFGFGRSDEPENQPGIGLLAEALVNESGLGRLNKYELDQALAGKNARVVFRVADDHFALKGASAADEVQLLFQLMAARLLDPAYREEAYRLVMERFGQVYAEMVHSVEDTMRLLGTRFLSGDDGRFGYPPREQFERLSLQDVRQWLTLFFEQAELELSIVGDINIDAVISLASQYLGSLAPRSGVARVRPVAGIRFPEGKTKTFKIDTRIPKALLVINYPTEDIWEIGRSRRLNILAEVFSERLRVSIREKLGAAYSPIAYNHPSRTYPGYGILSIMAYSDPDAVERLMTEIQKTRADLIKGKITVEELQRALDPVKTGIKDMVRRNGYWLDTVLTGSREHPEQLGWSQTLLSDYASIAPGEISDLARTYLQESRAAFMIFRPQGNSP